MHGLYSECCCVNMISVGSSGQDPGAPGSLGPEGDPGAPGAQGIHVTCLLLNMETPTSFIKPLLPNVSRMRYCFAQSARPRPYPTREHWPLPEEHAAAGAGPSWSLVSRAGPLQWPPDPRQFVALQPAYHLAVSLAARNEESLKQYCKCQQNIVRLCMLGSSCKAEQPMHL